MNTLFKILIFISILPAIFVGNIGLPWYVIFSPLVLVVSFLGIKNITRNFSILILIWCFLITEIFLTGIIQPYIKLDKLQFSFDFIIYTVKFLYFVFFFWLGYKKIISLNNFIKTLLIVLSIGMFIGILQWIIWWGSDFLSSLYTIGESQYRLATRTDAFVLRRISGIAHFATAQGGISAFVVLMAIGYWKMYKKNYTSIIAIILGILNLIACGGRAGQLMFFFGAFLFFIFYMSKRINRKKLKTFILFAGLVLLLIYLLNLFEVAVIKRNVDRFLYAFKEISEGGGRVDKISSAFTLMQTPLDYIIGVSRAVQQSAENVYIEAEFFNIFILYGGLGFVLHYSIIIILAYYFYKKMKRNIGTKKNVAISALVLLLSYQLFSLGYYFFREMYVGQIPWIVFGYFLGFLEKKHYAINAITNNNESFINS